MCVFAAPAVAGGLGTGVGLASVGGASAAAFAPAALAS